MNTFRQINQQTAAIFALLLSSAQRILISTECEWGLVVVDWLKALSLAITAPRLALIACPDRQNAFRSIRSSVKRSVLCH